MNSNSNYKTHMVQLVLAASFHVHTFMLFANFCKGAFIQLYIFELVHVLSACLDAVLLVEHDGAIEL